MSVFLQGLIMGLAYVAPIGLQNLFVINSALTQTKRRAYTTALIVIFFDVTLALACFFGIGVLMERFEWLNLIILLIGSVIVILIGIGLLRAKAAMSDETNVNVPILKLISTACVVTWFNPQALIDGTMMLGAMRTTLPPSEATTFILGVTIASFLWFFVVTTAITLFSAKFNDKILRYINIICGAIIIIYGFKLAINFVQIVF